MADGRIGSTRPIEAGLTPPVPYKETSHAMGSRAHLLPVQGDSSKVPQGITVDERGDATIRTPQASVRRV